MPQPYSEWNAIACPKDGYPLEAVSGNFATGVSMDGYHETRYEEGLFCEKCRTVYDPSDVIETEELSGMEVEEELVTA